MSAAPTRVVVVDDCDDNRCSLVQLLEMSGYTVRDASDGQTAIDLCERFDPHCVLIDVGLPGLGGLELARELRSRHGDDAVLIAVTGRDPRDAAVEATFEVVDHWFMKPVRAEELRKVLPDLG